MWAVVIVIVGRNRRQARNRPALRRHPGMGPHLSAVETIEAAGALCAPASIDDATAAVGAGPPPAASADSAAPPEGCGCRPTVGRCTHLGLASCWRLWGAGAYSLLTEFTHH